ncbi:cytidine deaminase [Saccharopolyspora griseoalba]|uniref:Cytidine deaminase n=1 Tax=Saccharopolyspora griseoalba TaxID=1431848 RepID=A0ABW2LKE8_9PSEU
MAEHVEQAAPQELDAEDAKIVTLARSARARNGAAEGAAVRDTDGRTYAATTVDLPSLRLTALQAAVAAAVSSGAEGLEASAVVTDAAELGHDSIAAAHDMTRNSPVIRANAKGEPQGVVGA